MRAGTVENSVAERVSPVDTHRRVPTLELSSYLRGSATSDRIVYYDPRKLHIVLGLLLNIDRSPSTSAQNTQIAGQSCSTIVKQLEYLHGVNTRGRTGHVVTVLKLY